MAKQNKVLEALLNVRKRIETEVVTIRRSDEEYEIDLYEARGINIILLEEINKVIEEGERTLKLKEVAIEKVRPINRKHRSRKRR